MEPILACNRQRTQRTYIFLLCNIFKSCMHAGIKVCTDLTDLYLLKSVRTHTYICVCVCVWGGVLVPT